MAANEEPLNPIYKPTTITLKHGRGRLANCEIRRLLPRICFLGLLLIGFIKLDSISFCFKSISTALKANEANCELLRCSSLQVEAELSCNRPELGCLDVSDGIGGDAWLLVSTNSSKVHDFKSKMSGCDIITGRFAMLGEGVNLWLHNWRISLCTAFNSSLHSVFLSGGGCIENDCIRGFSV